MTTPNTRKKKKAKTNFKWNLLESGVNFYLITSKYLKVYRD